MRLAGDPGEANNSGDRADEPTAYGQGRHETDNMGSTSLRNTVQDWSEHDHEAFFA